MSGVDKSADTEVDWWSPGLGAGWGSRVDGGVYCGCRVSFGGDEAVLKGMAGVVSSSP